MTEEEYNAIEKEKVMKSLSKQRQRIAELTKRIEDRCIENTADLMEMQYLQWEVDGMLEYLKIQAIDRHNDQLATWNKASPPAEKKKPI